MSIEEVTETTEETTTEETTTAAAATINSVSVDEHNKTLELLRIEREKAKASMEGLKAKELETMKANEKWQEIAELKQREAEEANEKLVNATAAIASDRKNSAVKQAAMQAGIKKEALDDLELYDFPEVQIETTSMGNINVIGAARAIESLKLKRPFLFGKKATALNTTTPGVVDGAKITVDDVLKAETKWSKSQAPADHAAYKTILLKYKRQ